MAKRLSFLGNDNNSSEEQHSSALNGLALSIDTPFQEDIYLSADIFFGRFSVRLVFV